MTVPRSVLAVGRAGAGINNIPGRGADEARHSGVQRAGRQRQRGEGTGARRSVPGGAQHLQAWAFAQSQSGDDHAIDAAVEEGKKNFVGFELPGRTLGVIGLGAIGVEVANAALGLGMKVLGYDPHITVQRAWQLSSNVEQAPSLDDAVRARRCRLGARAAQRRDARARERRAPEDDEAGRRGAQLLARGHRRRCGGDRARSTTGDCMPTSAISRTTRSRTIRRWSTLPHLGASTGEAEENCAVMVADTLRDFLENGNIRNCGEFPRGGAARARRRDAALRSRTATCRTWSARSPRVSPPPA